MQATEISGTNFAVETLVGATETAQSVAQAETSTSVAELPNDEATEVPTEEPTAEATEAPTEEPTEEINTEQPTVIGNGGSNDSPPGDVVYVVQEGDTLADIASRFDRSIEEIIEANNLNNRDVILSGDVLIIPPPLVLEDDPTPQPTATGTATPSPQPTPTVIPPTEVAAIPVRVVVVGEEIGIGTIRLFAPPEANHPETIRVELDLQLNQQIWTATPASDGVDDAAEVGPSAPADAAPTQMPAATQPPPGTPTTTPTTPTTPTNTPNFEESGLTVFQKMGASLFCLESSFTGCDEESDPAEAEIITDLERGIRWSWVIRPDETITGLQDLEVVLWRVVVADDGPQEADVICSHFFQISANPNLAATDSDRNSLPIIVGIAVLAVALAAMAYTGAKRLRLVRQRVGSKVFISYRRNDTWAVARNLYDQLESRGARVFLDVKDINEGRFAEIIETNIELCEYFIPVIGPDTLDSTWVRREIASAIAHDRVIIPVLVNGFTFTAPLPEDIKELESHNSITLMPEYLDAAIARLLQFMHLT